MATKQARELVPGDIATVGATRGTVASVTPNGRTRGVVVTFTNGLQAKTNGADEVTVHHVNTIGGAL